MACLRLINKIKKFFLVSRWKVKRTLTPLKKNFFKIILLVTSLIIIKHSFLYSYNCSYDWQHNPPWLCDVNNQYYETWEECNAYCYVAEDTGNNGNVNIDEQQFNFLNGIAGILSAMLIWQAWNNANK